MKIKYLLFTLSLFLLANVSYAGNSVNTEDHPTGIVQMKDFTATKADLKADKQLLKTEKQQYRAEKRMAWLSKIVNKKMAASKKKSLGGLDDPVDKFFWYWLIGWGAGILLSIIAAAAFTGGAFSGGFGAAWVLWLLAWLAWLGGSICGIIWLVKKLG